MPAKYFIRAGYVESNARPGASGSTTGPNAPLSNGKFDLHRWLRGELNAVGVQVMDPCCDTAATLAPLRYNVTTGHIQYLNPSTSVWTQAVL